MSVTLSEYVLSERAAPAQRFRKAARVGMETAAKSSFVVALQPEEGGAHHADCQTSRQIFGFNYEKCAGAESTMTGGVLQNNSLW